MVTLVVLLAGCTRVAECQGDEVAGVTTTALMTAVNTLLVQLASIPCLRSAEACPVCELPLYVMLAELSTVGCAAFCATYIIKNTHTHSYIVHSTVPHFSVDARVKRRGCFGHYTVFFPAAPVASVPGPLPARHTYTPLSHTVMPESSHSCGSGDVTISKWASLPVPLLHDCPDALRFHMCLLIISTHIHTCVCSTSVYAAPGCGVLFHFVCVVALCVCVSVLNRFITKSSLHAAG